MATWASGVCERKSGLHETYAASESLGRCERGGVAE